jgi:hypothetical protein
MSETTQISVALIVCKNDDEIGLFSTRLSEANLKYHYQENGI